MSVVGGVEPSTSGIAVRDFRWAMTQVVGEPAVKTALAKVPEETRAPFEQAPVLAWVPMWSISAVVTAVASEAGLEEEDLVTRAARLSTERTLNTLWRVLLRFTTDKAIIDRTPMMWERTRNVGKLAVVSHGAGTSTIELTCWPGMPRRQAVILCANIEAVMTCAGREEAKVAWKRTEDGAVYKVTWRVYGSR